MFKLIIKWFKKPEFEGAKRPKSIIFLLPDGYRIRVTKSHWDDGEITTYIAYRLEKDAKWDCDDIQLGSYKTWFGAAAKCWSSHRLHKQINRDLSDDAAIKMYVDGR